MEVAALGLKVDGAEGIERASDALEDLTRASDSAEKSTDKLAKRSNEGKRSIDALATSSGKATSVVAQLAVAALKVGAAIGIGLSINALKNYADAWSDMQSRVGSSIGDMDAAGAAMSRIVDIANASYSPLQQTVAVYSRNVATFKDIGRTATQAADFTEALNHALVTTATKGQDADVVINSLSRALATGALDAQSFDTIVSRSPRVLQAMADELGVTTSAMRQMAVDGKVTTDIIANGLINSLGELRMEAGRMPATLADAFVRVQNNITQLVGGIDKATGASSAIADVIMAFADAIQTAGKYLINFSSAIMPAVSTAFSALGTAATALAAVITSRLVAALLTYSGSALIGAIAGTVSFITSLTGLQVAMALAAVRAAAFTAAVRGLSVALAIVGGPLSAMVLLLGTLAYSLDLFGSSARENADKASLGLADSKMNVEQLVAAYQKLNEEQRNSVINIKTEDLARASSEVQKAIYDIGAAFEPSLAQGTKAAAQFRADFTSQITEVAQNATLSTEQMAAAINNIIQAHIASGQATEESKNKLISLAQTLVTASGNAAGLTNQIEALRNAQAGVANAATADLSPKGIEKWDEYLAKLTAARDMIGMNARQLGEFQAAQAGANSIQQQMSGIITAQTAEYRNLQTAIEGKDATAAAAAESNIRALDVEAQKVQLLAIKTQALMAATAAFAKNGIASDVAGGVLQNMLKGFAQAEAAIGVSAQAEAQIKNIYANTAPRKSGGGGGGSSGKSAIQTAAENDAKALKEVRREIELVQLAGEALAQAKARDKLSKYATPEQIDLMKQLTAELYRQQELKALRDKIGDNPQAYIRGTGSPSDVAQDPYSTYENDVEAEQKRYADQLTRLTEVMEAKKGLYENYYSEFERLQDEHNTRMGKIERASLDMSLGSAAQGFGQLASALKDSQGEQSSAYKAMFAASKAFSIAQASLALGSALAEAWRLPWPANIAALGVAAASMATIISSISAVSLAGQAHDGIMSIPEDGTWNLKKGERVTTANTSAKLDSVLERIDARQRAGRAAANDGAHQNTGNQRPIVNLIEDRNRAGEVSTQRNANGENEINIFVADIRGGGNASQALEQTYGLLRVGR